MRALKKKIRRPGNYPDLPGYSIKKFRVFIRKYFSDNFRVITQKLPDFCSMKFHIFMPVYNQSHGLVYEQIGLWLIKAHQCKPPSFTLIHVKGIYPSFFFSLIKFKSIILNNLHLDLNFLHVNSTRITPPYLGHLTSTPVFAPLFG